MESEAAQLFLVAPERTPYQGRMSILMQRARLQRPMKVTATG